MTMPQQPEPPAPDFIDILKGTSIFDRLPPPSPQFLEDDGFDLPPGPVEYWKGAD